MPTKCSDFVLVFLQPLCLLLQNPANCDRIRGHSASALINLLHPEHCDGEVLENQGLVDPILQSLMSPLTNAHNDVRAPCLSVIG